MRHGTALRLAAAPALLLITLVATSAESANASAKASAAIPLQGPPAIAAASGVDSLDTIIGRRLAGAAPSEGYAPADWNRVRRLYEALDHRAQWIDASSTAQPLRPRAATLLDAVAGASSHALVGDRSLERELRDALRDVRRDPGSTEKLAHAEILLSAAFVAYATDLLTGQVDPRSVNREWHIDPQDVDVDSTLIATLRHDSFATALSALPPQDADYALLRGELARYRALVADGGWPRTPPLGVLRPGDTATMGALGVLMARLHAEAYATLLPLLPATPGDSDRAMQLGAETPVVYDATLAGAVAEYQRRHELVVDSIVGPSTLASLNRSADFRLRQIAANLERHRWLPRQRDDRYVLVNVPAFRLRAFDGGREVLSMKVVVGAEYGGRTTPVFSDSMAYVVFQPYWNVPQGIADRELWPKQRQDPGYFARNDYEVVRASWGTYVRQRPSPGNALGRAKFIFPNEYAIYLHDTPAQALFDERVRAFSHGCIRVEHPDQLAEFVLGPQGWDIDRVRDAMTGGSDDHRVNLERKLPVYIVYFTTYTRDGALYFGNDIYDRDDALVRAVPGVAAPSDRTAHELQGLRMLSRDLVGARESASLA